MNTLFSNIDKKLTILENRDSFGHMVTYMVKLYAIIIPYHGRFYMPKVLFVFAGTGDTAKNIANNHEQYECGDDVVRVYVNGCQDKAVGGSYIFGQLSPNLDKAGAKVRDCFDDTGNLSIDALKKKFGSSIEIHPITTEGTVPVESIGLMGFSRGAVTTFSAARHLDDLGKPIQIFATDPVPGETLDGATGKSSQFQKNYDLTQCINITRAEVIIGGYRSEVNMVHDKFFSQMAPRFNPACDSRTYTVPKKHHLYHSGATANQRSRFLVETGFSTAHIHFDESYDSPFFTPRVIAQRHHAQEAMNLELLPPYREKLCASLEATYPEPEQFDDQTLRALFALQQCAAPSSAKKELETSILSDKTPRGDAIRSYVIDLEDIIQHVLKKSADKMDSPAINKLRNVLYKQAQDYLASPTPEDKVKFIKNMNQAIKELKPKLTEKEYKELKKLSKLFAADSTLLNSDLRTAMQLGESTKDTPVPSSTSSADQIARQKGLKAALHTIVIEAKPLQIEAPPEESHGRTKGP